MPKFMISREIGIDAGHRVTEHHSRCRNCHGHRYTVQAWCSGELEEQGSTAGMAGGLDFSFLKEEMVAVIDELADHGFIFWRGDTEVSDMFSPDPVQLGHDLSIWWAQVDADLARQGYHAGNARHGMKILILPVVPTAENLAKFWYDQLQPRVRARTQARAQLVSLKVWETPNCWASYPAGVL